MATNTQSRKVCSREDIAFRLNEANKDADRLRALLRGNEHHAYYIPAHTALQIAEQRIDALMLALSEG